MTSAVPWDDGKVARRITHERLTSYLSVVDGGVPRAVALYDWNAEVAAALLAVGGRAEVVVRNALDERLSRWSLRRHGTARWFSRLPLDAKGASDIDTAVRRATRSGSRPERHGQVVTELPFGFWRYLVAVRYLTSLWVPTLHVAFPHGPSDLRERRARVERHLDRLLFVRNRVAHHEPVHRRDSKISTLPSDTHRINS